MPARNRERLVLCFAGRGYTPPISRSGAGNGGRGRSARSVSLAGVRFRIRSRRRTRTCGRESSEQKQSSPRPARSLRCRETSPRFWASCSSSASSWCTSVRTCTRSDESRGEERHAHREEDDEAAQADREDHDGAREVVRQARAAVAWLLFLIIVGFGIVNYLVTRRIATAEGKKS